MPIIANWIHPTDVLGSIQAGVHAGLSLRAQEQAAQEAQANREERAQLAADSLKERTLLSSMHMLELAADRAERAGFHKESVDARRAADVLRDRHDQMLEKLSAGREAETGLHNIAMEDIAQQRADELLSRDEKSLTRLDLPPGYYQQGGHVVNIKDQSVVPAGAERALISGMNLYRQQLADPNTPKDMKLQVGAQLTELQNQYAKLKALPTVTPGTPSSWLRGIPGTPAVTNFPPGSASAALQPPPTQGTIPAPVPGRIRVREKATGQTGWWEGTEPPSDGYEIVE